MVSWTTWGISSLAGSTPFWFPSFKAFCAESEPPALLRFDFGAIAIFAGSSSQAAYMLFAWDPKSGINITSTERETSNHVKRSENHTPQTDGSQKRRIQHLTVPKADRFHLRSVTLKRRAEKIRHIWQKLIRQKSQPPKNRSLVTDQRSDPSLLKSVRNPWSHETSRR